jgi:TolB-like protein/Tfp pilus assembly protein PilF
LHGRRPALESPSGARRIRLPLSSRQRWDQTVARCLAPNPTARFERVIDVRRAITPLLRHPAVLTAAAAAAVVAALLTAVVVSTRTARPTVPTVAVIPFESEALPPGSEHLSEGIADSLIHTLAQFPNLSVIARSSSFQFANRTSALDDMAKSLGASLVVIGRIRPAGNRFVISAELVNPRTHAHLWGAEFDADVVSLGGLEQVLARRIAEQIGAKLNAPVTDLENPNSPRARAHELLLRGQYQRRLYTPESRQRAIAFFEQALVVDPQFALANAELANTYRLLSGGGVLDATHAMPAAEAAARRALAADPNLAEAHAAFADIYKDQWHWSAAEEEYRTAIRLKPSLADAHMGYGILLSITGRYDAALQELRLVRRLDPVGMPGALHAAAVHYNGRQYARALEELARARALDPRAPSPWAWTGLVLGGSGRYREALEAYRVAIKAGDDTLANQCFYVYSLARSGDRAEAQRQFDQVLQSRAFVPLTALAVAYSGLGQPDRAIELLQQAFVKPDPILQYLKVESHYDDLKERSEYIELAAKLRLP